MCSEIKRGGFDEGAAVAALFLFAASHARSKLVTRRTVAELDASTAGRSASVGPAARSSRSRSMSPVFVTCFGKVPVSISRRNSNGMLLTLHRVDVSRPDRRPGLGAVTHGTVGTRQVRFKCSACRNVDFGHPLPCPQEPQNFALGANTAEHLVHCVATMLVPHCWQNFAPG
jgi:hypothetical protein